MPARLGLAALALVLPLVACDEPPEEARFDLKPAVDVQNKVADLEARVQALDERVDTLGGGAAARPAGPKPEVIAKFRKMVELHNKGEFEEAKKLVAELEKEIQDPRGLQQLQGFKEEIEVVGKEAIPLEAEMWFGDKQASMDDGEVTLLVFWEVWCPHCQREVPELQATYEKYQGKGLNVVGLTQLSRGKTEEDVKGFLAEKSVTYPTAKTGAELPRHYGVRGIPAAAVVKDGKVVWRGHPGNLNEGMLQDWLGS